MCADDGVCRARTYTSTVTKSLADSPRFGGCLHAVIVEKNLKFEDENEKYTF